MPDTMSEIGLWVTPLLLLPGVALLVMSTSIRYNRLHDELHQLGESPSAEHVATLLRRGRLFRDALLALYASVACFALAALAGGLLVWWQGGAQGAMLALTALGIAAVLAAAVMLVRESLLSFEELADDAGRRT